MGYEGAPTPMAAKLEHLTSMEIEVLHSARYPGKAILPANPREQRRALKLDW
jgi:hypothetical protein